MPCYHPIEAFDLSPDRNPLLDYDKVLSFRGPSSAEERERLIRDGRRVLLPCRKCLGCRLAYSREWANRCMMESQYHDHTWFLTLTYDDDHLPRTFSVDRATGEAVSPVATLVKRDLQLFFKRLRKRFDVPVRYFACGEYGSKTFRPHYHVILFGPDFVDRRPILGSPGYFESDILHSLWPHGFHVLGAVTWSSCAYVANYVLKKAGPHQADLKRYSRYHPNIDPEFRTMSLKPAIGYQYYVDHPHIFDHSNFSLSTPDGGVICYPPAYFKRLHRESHPQRHFERTQRALEAIECEQHIKISLTSKLYDDILNDEERRKFSELSRYRSEIL